MGIIPASRVRDNVTRNLREWRNLRPQPKVARGFTGDYALIAPAGLSLTEVPLTIRLAG